jgi:SAM-dependent methyltransferase
MKIQESGMPDEQLWNTFFDVKDILGRFFTLGRKLNIVEIGSGYGTFSVEIAKDFSTNLLCYDIDPIMISFLTDKKESEKLGSIHPILGDIVTNGTDLDRGSIDAVIMFNILHHSDNSVLLKEAYRILKKNGFLCVLHWNYDSKTPRGPSISVRPQPSNLIKEIANSGFSIDWGPENIGDWHYGIKATKLF